MCGSWVVAGSRDRASGASTSAVGEGRGWDMVVAHVRYRHGRCRVEVVCYISSGELCGMWCQAMGAPLSSSDASSGATMGSANQMGGGYDVQSGESADSWLECRVRNFLGGLSGLRGTGSDESDMAVFVDFDSLASPGSPGSHKLCHGSTSSLIASALLHQR